MTSNINSPAHGTGRLIAKYLQEFKNGATVADLVQYLKNQHTTCNQPPDELNQIVESVLTDGATMGFLERKGSKFLYWVAKEMRCGRRRRRRSRCRRRRRRSCSRRRRRRRRCSRRRRRRCRRRRRRRSCSPRRRCRPDARVGEANDDAANNRPNKSNNRTNNHAQN